MAKKAVRMRTRGVDVGYRDANWWEVCLAGRWLMEDGQDHRIKTGCRADGEAWARREYGADVIIEWVDG